MTLAHQTQPAGSNQCGQTCIAMIVGKPRSNIIKMIGRGLTSTKDLRKGFDIFGFDMKELTRCKRFIEFTIPYEQWHTPVVARVHFQNVTRTHWVVLTSTMVHDPAFGFAMDHESYYAVMRRDCAYFTSYAHVVQR